MQDYVEDVMQLAKILTPKDIELMTDKKFRYVLKIRDDYHSALMDLADEHGFHKVSEIKGWKRYTSDALSQMTVDLEVAEDQLKDALVPFIRLMFKKFHENKETFAKAIMCVAELDCLCALGFLSADQSLGPMVRPVVHDANKTTNPFINLENMRHPAVQL